MQQMSPNHCAHLCRWEYIHRLQKNLWPCAQWQGVLPVVRSPRRIY